MSDSQNNNGFERAIEFVLVIIALKFAWHASAALDYYGPLFERVMRKGNHDLFQTCLYWVATHGQFALLIVTIIILPSALLSSNDDGAGAGFLLLLLAGTGWFLGRRFTDAVVQKTMCSANSIWGCALDGPIFIYMGFSILVVLCAVFCILGTIGMITQVFSPETEPSKR